MAERDGSEEPENVRDAVERSRSGAPAAGAVVRDRFSADEVFQRIVAAADEELSSENRELFFSGLAAGFAISITVLLTASLTASTNEHPVLSALLYPLGFIYMRDNISIWDYNYAYSNSARSVEANAKGHPVH